jgi:transposase
MWAMKPYSENLRLRIVWAVRDEMPKSAAARLFGVCLSYVKRYATNYLPAPV